MLDLGDTGKSSGTAPKPQRSRISTFFGCKRLADSLWQDSPYRRQEDKTFGQLPRPPANVPLCIGQGKIARSLANTVRGLRACTNASTTCRAKLLGVGTHQLTLEMLSSLPLRIGAIRRHIALPTLWHDRRGGNHSERAIP